MNGIEWGSVADWFSGIVTALGIYIAIKQTKIRIKIKFIKEDETFAIEVINKSNVEVNINEVFAYYYTVRFGENPVMVVKMMDDEMNGPIIINGQQRLLFEAGTKYSNVDKDFLYVKYGCAYQGGFVKQNKIRRKVDVERVIPEG